MSLGTPESSAPVLDRPQALRRARLLNRVTIGWNVIEAVVALAAGVAAGSLGLVAFGLDSCVEVSGALVLAWRLAREQRTGCTQPDDRRANRALAVCFFALAGWVSVNAVLDLADRHQPEVSGVGIMITTLSLLTMPALARAKRRLAPVLGSRAQEREASQTRLCAVLSAVVLGGLVLNAALGWWWADPVAALVVAALAAVEGTRSWRAESLADTCCA
jgi:divalent metal cation (Fe/Co/Zn/Cd) transporter